MDKMWAGRTVGTTADLVDEINSSIAVDRRLYKRDIAGSKAHAMMMAKQGIIPRSEANMIIDGLNGICADIESGALPIDPTAEDIHMFVEKVLIICSIPLDCHPPPPYSALNSSLTV